MSASSGRGATFQGVPNPLRMQGYSTVRAAQQFSAVSEAIVSARIAPLLPANQAYKTAQAEQNPPTARNIGVSSHTSVGCALVCRGTPRTCMGRHLETNRRTSAGTRAGRRWRCPRPWPPAPAAGPPPVSIAAGPRPAYRAGYSSHRGPQNFCDGAECHELGDAVLNATRVTRRALPLDSKKCQYKQ